MLFGFRSVRFIIIFVAILLFSGCNPFKKNDTAGMPKKDIKQTPSEESKRKLLREIERDYENAEAHYKLGKLYQSDGLWAQAENQYRIALNFDPVYREAQAARVKALINEGDTAKSKLLADIYIDQASNSAFGSLKLALAFQSESLDEYAMTCYQQALRLNPNSAKINRQIGYYYLSKGDKTRAQDYLRRSFQLDPMQPEVAHELGRLGVAIRIPRKKTRKDTKKIDKLVEQSDEELMKQE
jgi:tetratricopeptide (TPR) repeat protein